MTQPQSMTGDPDLDQAIEDLEWTAINIRTVEGQLIGADDIKDYLVLARRKAELADLKGIVAARAERLNMKPRALVLIVELARRYKMQNRRRPSAAQMANVLRMSADAAERDRDEAAANLVMAQHECRQVRARLDAALGALDYLEASR